MFAFFAVPLAIAKLLQWIFFNKGCKMVLYNFKAYEKDTSEMPFPSPSGSLKNSAVIEEAK